MVCIVLIRVLKDLNLISHLNIKKNNSMNYHALKIGGYTNDNQKNRRSKRS